MSAGDWKDLLAATESGDLDLVKYHIEGGVDPNYQHPEFMTTPLIHSIEYQHHAITQYLLENGADHDLCAGFSNDSPLKIAKRYKNRFALRLLKSYLSKPFWRFW